MSKYNPPGGVLAPMLAMLLIFASGCSFGSPPVSETEGSGVSGASDTQSAGEEYEGHHGDIVSYGGMVYFIGTRCT